MEHFHFRSFLGILKFFFFSFESYNVTVGGVVMKTWCVSLSLYQTRRLKALKEEMGRGGGVNPKITRNWLENDFRCIAASCWQQQTSEKEKTKEENHSKKQTLKYKCQRMKSMNRKM